MKKDIDINLVKEIVKVDITAEEAFVILCKRLDMEFVLDEDRDFSVENGMVYETENGNRQEFDDRADLFVSLRNVAACMYPNTYFRGEDYIYVNKE